jgi:type II secretory pathway pseudopilin PulG
MGNLSKGLHRASKTHSRSYIASSPVVLVLVAVLSSVSMTLGQTSSAAQSEADKYFSAQDWEHAARAYQAMTASDPSDSQAWFKLGLSLQSAGKGEEAIPAYQKALDTGFQPSVAPMLRLARIYSALGKTDQALDWLNKAADTGFVPPGVLKTSTEFDAIRDDSRFKELFARVLKAAEPCKNSPDHRQFDFWVGEWNVQNPLGQPAGTSSIQQILDDCIIFENWTGQGGYTGKSFNLYNKVTGKWEQIWVDSMGAITKYEGQLVKDGVLEYHFDSTQPDGSAMHHRLTFFKLGPDRVRQFSELSADDGKTWTTEYDLTYIRKKE